MNKPIEDFKMRFNKALILQAVKPVDLSEKTGLSRSTISHYMSGYTKPKSDKLYTLAKALDVNEAWLMGYDVPMERHDYEDPRIVERDEKLQDIEKILENVGYTLSCESFDDDYFRIKNAFGQTIASFYDYELLSRYDSLKKKGRVSVKLLLSSESAFYKYLESLGYYIDKDDLEHKPFIHYGNGAVRIPPNQLDDIRTRIDTYAKVTLDSIILKLNEDELRQQRLEKEKTLRHLRGENIYEGTQFEKGWNNTHLDADAAHSRTDIVPEECTEELKQQEDDIMDNDDLWK